MTSMHRAPRSLESVIEAYVHSRSKSQGSLSTSRAIRAVRTLLPALALSDRELENLIAKSALRWRMPVAFDAADDLQPKSKQPIVMRSEIEKSATSRHSD
jgi:hypothetical protein